MWKEANEKTSPQEDEEFLFNELEFPINQFDEDSLFEFDDTIPAVPLSLTLQAKDVQLEKTVDLFGGISLIIGAIIGSGIFASPGPVLKYTNSVGASIIVWILAGVLAMTGGLCYAELGTMMPLSGGEHPYLMRAFGAYPAFLFAWTGILASRPGSIAIISSICSEYLVKLLFGQNWSNLLITRLLAILIVLGLTAVNIKSTKYSTHIQVLTTAIKLLSIVVISILGFLTRIEKSALETPLFDTAISNPGNYALAFFSALWAYDGWNNLNIVAGEIENPARNIPVSIVISSVVVTLSYVATNLAYYSTLSFEVVGQSKTIAMDFGSVALGRLGSIVIPLIVIFSTAGAANASILTGSRVTFISSQNGHAPKVFSKISTNNTPVNALLFQALFSIGLIIYGDFQDLVNMYSIIAWAFYFLSVLSLCILRITEPFAPRPFKVWLICPILFLIASASLLTFSIFEAPSEGLLALVFLTTGTVTYLANDYFQRIAFMQPASYESIAETLELNPL